MPASAVCGILFFMLQFLCMENKNERVQIFVDGGNFYHLVLKKLGISENDFSLDDFAKFLANGREIVNSFSQKVIH